MRSPDPFRPGWFLRRWWSALLAGGTALGLLNFFYFWLDDVVRDRPVAPWPILVEELTAAYGAALLVTLIVWAAFRWPMDQPGRLRRVPVHLLGALAYSGLKTTWIWLTRSVLFPLFGWGTYDYGAMPVRYLMELPSDLILYSVTLLVAYLVAHARRARDQQLAVSRLEARLAEARLSALRAQLDPHFLFNALNAISAVMYEDVGRADAMLARLSDLLRVGMAADGERQEVELGEELELVETYLDLMRLRFGDRLFVTVDIPPRMREIHVPQLVLQPLLENSLKHGVPEPPARARVAVSAELDGVLLRLVVADNGPGFRGTAPAASGGAAGIGLANTRARLAELYGSRAALRVEDRVEGGARVVVELPARTSMGVVAGSAGVDGVAVTPGGAS